ncbi:hypothetical protein FOV72_18160 [Gordonia rubripertincta]|nr:hypothetical protein FOV72_18160 [Gordonia rubripertincta]
MAGSDRRQSVIGQQDRLRSRPVYRDPMQFDGLHAVADYAALYTSLRQSAFVDFLRERLGAFDVRCAEDNRTVVFARAGTDSPRDEATVVRSRASLVAVLEPSAIIWGWAHPCGDHTGPASRLREAGARLGIEDLTSPRVTLPPKPSHDADDPGDRVLDVIAAAAVGSTGVSPYCTVRLDDDDRGVFLLDDVTLPEPTFADFATRMPEVLSSLAVNDHRVAIHGMAARRGWHISWRTGTDGGRSPICDVTDGRSVVRVNFDRRGRPVDYRCELADADRD